jgi:hypothetical protein
MTLPIHDPQPVPSSNHHNNEENLAVLESSPQGITLLHHPYRPPNRNICIAYLIETINHVLAITEDDGENNDAIMNLEDGEGRGHTGQRSAEDEPFHNGRTRD